jgi:FkbM family methyltransferase
VVGNCQFLGRARYWVVHLSSLFFGQLPGDICFKSKDGHLFRGDLNDTIYNSIFFFGYHEPLETSVVQAIVRKGDTVFDVGANIGWYSVQFGKIVGERGKVFAFEPVPEMFDELQRNLLLNDLFPTVRALRLAVGDECGEINLHVFSGLPRGHASISDFGRTDVRRYEVPLTTLDEFVRDNSLARVDVIKCDVEGAELLLLRGAVGLLRSPNAPVWLIEIAPTLCAAFGHSPADIFEILKPFGYEFYRIRKGARLELIPSHEYREYNGNVLCFVRTTHGARIEHLVF